VVQYADVRKPSEGGGIRGATSEAGAKTHRLKPTVNNRLNFPYVPEDGARCLSEFRGFYFRPKHPGPIEISHCDGLRRDDSAGSVRIPLERLSRPPAKL
jgi:hypothetical protein